MATRQGKLNLTCDRKQDCAKRSDRKTFTISHIPAWYVGHNKL